MHLIEILTNTVNVGASIAIIAFLLVLLRLVQLQGREVVITRLFLKPREATRAATLLVAGLLVFLTSNALELFGDVYHLDWVVNEVVETASLFVMLAGLYQFAAILQLPARVAIAVSAKDARVQP